MDEFQEQAREFLNSCNATIEIKYVGLEMPTWDSQRHCVYDCKIKTPRSEMEVHFYDSLHNTEIQKMTLDEYIKRKYKSYSLYMPNIRIRAAENELKKIKEKAVPTEYDILACIQKYDVGTMDDFISDFGYEIHCVKDMFDLINTYTAVVKEYEDVCRCFTEEEIGRLAEIQ